MNTRLGRMIDWLFYGGDRGGDGVSTTDLHASLHPQPRVHDRARYDSGSAFFNH